MNESVGYYRYQVLVFCMYFVISCIEALRTKAKRTKVPRDFSSSSSGVIRRTRSAVAPKRSAVKGYKPRSNCDKRTPRNDHCRREHERAGGAYHDYRTAEYLSHGSICISTLSCLPCLHNFYLCKAMMKRQMREAAADQQEAARVACLAKRQEARERRAEERKVQQMKQREFQRELPA